MLNQCWIWINYTNVNYSSIIYNSSQIPKKSIRTWKKTKYTKVLRHHIPESKTAGRGSCNKIESRINQPPGSSNSQKELGVDAHTHAHTYRPRRDFIEMESFGSCRKLGANVPRNRNSHRHRIPEAPQQQQQPHWIGTYPWERARKTHRVKKELEEGIRQAATAVAVLLPESSTSPATLHRSKAVPRAAEPP